MKNNRVVCFFLFLVLCPMVFPIVVLANASGYVTESVSEEKKAEIIERIDLTPLSEEPTKREIRLFDVNLDGLIAICTQTPGHEKCVAVYTTSGEFLYGFEIDTSGELELYWNGDRLVIHPTRGDLAITISPDGEILEVETILETKENEVFWYEMREPTRSVNGYTYRLENDMGILRFFAQAYGKLVITTPDGEEYTFYDVTADYMLKLIFILIAIVVFVGLVVCILIYCLFKRRESSGPKETRAKVNLPKNL